jgi:hypothetical protein
VPTLDPFFAAKMYAVTLSPKFSDFLVQPRSA